MIRLLYVPVCIFFILILFGPKCSGPPKPDLYPDIQEREPASLEQLETDLRSENSQRKAQAILELADRNERKYIPDIRRLMNGPDRTLHGPAVLALGIYKDRPSISNILNFLNENSGVGQDTVLEALARMEDPSIGSKLLPLLESEDSTIRLLTVETLVRIKATGISSSLLNAAFKNSNVEKTKTYAMAIGKLRIKEGESFLIRLADTIEPGPSLAAVYLALGRIGSKRAVPLLVSALKGSFDKGRENSTQALIEIHDPSAVPLVLPLISDPNREIRYRAADVLIGIPIPMTGQRLSEVLRKSTPEAKGPASHVLGRLKYLPSRELIEQVLNDVSVPDREIIAQSLGYMGDKRSIPVLSKVLKESSGEARYGAAWALGGIGNSDALPLLEEATDSKDLKLARIASESLGMIASPRSLALLDRKTEQFPDLAPSTLGAIASIRGEEAEKVLEKYARHKNWNLHQVAVSQLGARKDAKSIPVLISLLEDNETPRNRKMVTAALRSITGEKFFSKNEWLNWYKNRK
ncbi:HEAT repeat protein [Leptospira inadai serovar Lyme str. 10]|uniref:HEAT repeat protein n=2 Tax=Leptospira inadai serovar Lyme TaxID=293084 RepID=V6HR74_9LEPT|nr:HEAT repeat domain-containing protein [Leptospira inadai]EQA34984.1 HEAT repeat protein [Leptospira inadai serovar Lyme str. 10]